MQKSWDKRVAFDLGYSYIYINRCMNIKEKNELKIRNFLSIEVRSKKVISTLFIGGVTKRIKSIQDPIFVLLTYIHYVIDNTKIDSFTG